MKLIFLLVIQRYARLLWLCFGLWTGLPAIAQQNHVREGAALLLDIQGVIGPATSSYVGRALAKGGEEDTALIILRLDTPGGLDTSMRDIIRGILASPVPVVGYVAPSGARAASAGTYIMYASHIAAMAPATNLGAATPVQIPLGATPPRGSPSSEGEEQKKEEPPPDDIMARKAVSDAVAYIRGLAQLRDRNAEWAERAVREAVSLSAQEALELGVINFIANDIPDLLRALDGYIVNIPEGKITLKTVGMPVTHLEPNWRDRLLAVIANPNVAYILMLIGIYGLIFELSNPGLLVPGVIGTISLFLALYAFQVLPISYAGLGLMVLGVAFMVAEAFIPSFGALGLGGMIAFVIGSVILLDTEIPGYEIAWPLIIAAALSSAAFLFLILSLAIRSQRRSVVTGREQMIGSIGKIAAVSVDRVTVRVHGELWSAQAAEPVVPGQRVRITGLKGLTLEVKPELEEEHDN
jgi:membrane-bound serine protease (ClpP class)